MKSSSWREVDRKLAGATVLLDLAFVKGTSGYHNHNSPGKELVRSVKE